MIVITLTEKGLPFTFKILSFERSPEASTTEHPIELGAEVTDHVQVRPERYTFEAIVATEVSGVGATIGAATLFLEQALGQLCSLLVVGEGTFPSVVLEAFPHRKTAAAERQFTLRFRQVRIAMGASITIPARMPAPVAKAGAPGEAALGQQATTPAPESLAHAALALLGLGS